MADDVLRMQAEVVDRFTGPLRSLQSQLRGIQSGSGVKAIKDGFDSAEKSALALGNSVRTVVNPALAAVGITGLGVAAALAGVGAALRGFSTDTAKLSFLSREVGVSAERLRVLESVGSKFGLSAEEMAGGVRTFSDNLDQIKRRTGGHLQLSVVPGPAQRRDARVFQFADGIQIDGRGRGPVSGPSGAHP